MVFFVTPLAAGTPPFGVGSMNVKGLQIVLNFVPARNGNPPRRAYGNFCRHEIEFFCGSNVRERLVL
jgi:hypothetical protein